MTDTILFDLDDTLLNFTENELVSILDTFSRFGVPSTREAVDKYLEINRVSWRRLERGEWTREEVLVGRFRELFSQLGVAADPAEVQKYYAKRLSLEGSYVDGAQELLLNLRGKYRLFAVTNGNTDVQEGRISVTKIDRLLDGIFISEKIGADKPSAKFFDAVFEKIGGSRDNCVIVGDSLSSDIQGGINAGIRTVYFNPKGKENETGITPDYEIYELSQITALLEEM
ncbi:MAG: YjjG family noncanonical pyrimidine nucleotidase [Clostridia bacterium]|nr:YjjG family noncanonical pyrimidine nucleotidase [Clostridia bacterium]